MKNIETKFNPEDKVWVIYEGKAKQAPVYDIEIKLKTKTEIRYTVDLGTEKDRQFKFFDESQCFATREELIESL
jgi:hypothetical protein